MRRASGAKVTRLTLGDLVLRLKGRRPALRWELHAGRSEKSAEAIVAVVARRRRAEHEEPNRHEGLEWTAQRQARRLRGWSEPGGPIYKEGASILLVLSIGGRIPSGMMREGAARSVVHCPVLPLAVPARTVEHGRIMIPLDGN